MGMIRRPCSKCGTTDYPKFKSRRKKPDGTYQHIMHGWCILCERERIRDEVEKIPQEKRTAYAKKWREENREEYNRKARERREKKRDKINAQKREWYAENKKRIIASKKIKKENVIKTKNELQESYVKRNTTRWCAPDKSTYMDFSSKKAKK
jgi:hypothetical protein